MTRINLVPPSELCDQHLLAEHRELTRIPNAVLRGRYSLENQPKEYTLGKGHVKFFYDKLGFLYRRYDELWGEATDRGFKVVYRIPEPDLPIDLIQDLYYDYTPTPEALALNRARIAERLEAMKPRWTPHK